MRRSIVRQLDVIRLAYLLGVTPGVVARCFDNVNRVQISAFLHTFDNIFAEVLAPEILLDSGTNEREKKKRQKQLAKLIQEKLPHDISFQEVAHDIKQDGILKKILVRCRENGGLDPRHYPTLAVEGRNAQIRILTGLEQYLEQVRVFKIEKTIERADPSWFVHWVFHGRLIDKLLATNPREALESEDLRNTESLLQYAPRESCSKEGVNQLSLYETFLRRIQLGIASDDFPALHDMPHKIEFAASLSLKELDYNQRSRISKFSTDEEEKLAIEVRIHGYRGTAIFHVGLMRKDLALITSGLESELRAARMPQHSLVIWRNIFWDLEKLQSFDSKAVEEWTKKFFSVYSEANDETQQLIRKALEDAGTSNPDVKSVRNDLKIPTNPFLEVLNV